MAAQVDPLRPTRPFQGGVAGDFPALPQSFEVGDSLRCAEIATAVGAVAFFRAAFLWGLGVMAAKVVFGITVDAVHPPFGEHQVNMRLFVSVGGLRVVDRPLVGVAPAEFLLNKSTHQGEPLRGSQFARQGDFQFPVGGAVGSFVGVSGLPEPVGFGVGPDWEVTGFLRFQPFTMMKSSGVLRFPRDIGGVRGGFSHFAKFHRESGEGHVDQPRFGFGGYVVGGEAPSTARFLGDDRQGGGKKPLSAPLLKQRILAAHHRLR